MAESGPVSSEVADVQLSHGSVPVPGDDLRARAEPGAAFSGGKGRTAPLRELRGRDRQV